MAQQQFVPILAVSWQQTMLSLCLYQAAKPNQQDAMTQVLCYMQQKRCARSAAQADRHACAEGGNLAPGQSVWQCDGMPEGQPERSQQPAGLLTAHHDALLNAGQANCWSISSSTHTHQEGSVTVLAMCPGLVCMLLFECAKHVVCACISAILPWCEQSMVCWPSESLLTFLPG